MNKIYRLESEPSSDFPRWNRAGEPQRSLLPLTGPNHTDLLVIVWRIDNAIKEQPVIGQTEREALRGYSVRPGL